MVARRRQLAVLVPGAAARTLSPEGYETEARRRAAWGSRRPAASTMAPSRSTARQPDARLARTTESNSLAAQSAQDLDRTCSIRPLPGAGGGRYLKYRPPPVHPGSLPKPGRLARRTPRLAGAPPRAVEAVPSTYFYLLAAPLLACFLRLLRQDLPFVDQGGSAGRGPTTGRRRGAGAAAPQSVRLSPDAQQVARRKGSD